MALSSALFSGTSGLTSMGDTMQIIGDNIANVNTIGFKSSQADFQDLLSQSLSTMSGTTQIGSGSAIGNVSASFEQGSFKTTGNATDLAIGGSGFFILREESGVSEYYTRAGNFSFDKEGNLVNPNGHVVQGWGLDPETGNDLGSVGDIKLNSFTSQPSQSTNVQVIANLDSKADDNSVSTTVGTPAATFPAGSLQAGWDGTASTPIPDANFEYQTTVQVYDSLGSTHDITLYFDKAAPATDSKYEFMVTCNPNEDQRDNGGTPIDPSADAHAGVLGFGKIEFDAASGAIKDISMSSVAGDGTETSLNTATDLTNGLFTFEPDFGTGAMSVSLDFGSTYNGTSWANNALSTTQYAVTSNTIFKDSNGYGAGDLQDINVNDKGVITGNYSNGEIIPLYRVALAGFQNEQGLVKEGGNLFRSTLASGAAITNRPGSNGLGSLAPGSLEQSNVDIAAEFVEMITTQRGFQANSKIITTVDTMLSEIINIKR
ncbi:MAG: flagellar hook protein FlgE [Desulfotignum sp.]|nr:flagellar hook protein FlgE [Desulfotignum sp.]MCF8136100.1 flagellar hook protein FlgE [Desulfotignum sp.]